MEVRRCNTRRRAASLLHNRSRLRLRGNGRHHDRLFAPPSISVIPDDIQAMFAAAGVSPLTNDMTVSTELQRRLSSSCVERLLIISPFLLVIRLAVTHS